MYYTNFDLKSPSGKNLDGDFLLCPCSVVVNTGDFLSLALGSTPGRGIYSKGDNMVNIIKHIRNGQKATFKFYRGEILFFETEQGLLFEIPISETGGAVFNAEEKASTLMKWIRKQLEVNEEGKKDSHP